MGKKMYVKESLDSEMITSGRLLLEELDQETPQVKAALWFYFEESESWRLILAFPQVEKTGPKVIYTRVQKLFNALRKKKSLEFSSRFDLNDVAIVSSHHAIVELMSSAIKTGPGINGLRFSRNTINGTFIEDAYIYRLS